MKRILCASVLACIPAMALAEPALNDQKITADEDVYMVQRYGSTYTPQTAEGKKASQEAVREAARAAASDPCKGSSWTAKAMCANAARDLEAQTHQFRWMDLIYGYDAKVLQLSVDADAKHIKGDEVTARLKVAEYEFQEAVEQRTQAAEEQSNAQQAAQAEQAHQQAQQQAVYQAQQDALRAQQQALEQQTEAAERHAKWQALFNGLAAMGSGSSSHPPVTTNCQKIGFMVNCTTQ